MLWAGKAALRGGFICRGAAPPLLYALLAASWAASPAAGLQQDVFRKASGEGSLGTAFASQGASARWFGRQADRISLSTRELVVTADGQDSSCYSDQTMSKPKDDKCGGSERLLFLHIPKNAGTAIEVAAEKEGIMWGRNMDFKSCGQGPGKCQVQWHEPPAFLSSTNVYTNAKVFCTVRNPFSRVVSEYGYIHDNEPYQWDNAQLIQHRGCTPAGLNEWIARMMLSYLGGDHFLQLCHLVPQTTYIWGPPKTWIHQCTYCQEILHVEEFPHSFNSFMARHNYSVRLNSTPVNEGGCPNLTPKNINATVQDLVRKVYSVDFALLNYSANAADAE